MNITIKSDEDKKALEVLNNRHDPEGERLKRILAMPDLSRMQGSPIYELAQRIIGLEDFKDFDVI